jgi:hypothetical protein
VAIQSIKRLVVLGLAVTTSTALIPAQTKNAAPSDRRPDSFQIYSLIMPGQVFTDMDAGGPWAIADTTVNEDDMNPKLAPEAFLQPPADNPRGFQEAVSDYNQRKKERLALKPPPRLNLSRPYVLLAPADVAQFKAARTSPMGSSDDQSKYSQYLGIIFLSEVYFNTAQTSALVYILDWCGNLCSQAVWVYLEKRDGAWVLRSGKAPPQT